ncbi:MAG TPA: tetratricopeptide repeat protein [Nitrospirota bacterium]|nr:tetratricopeptide repeat protein [Nitrospirota bacterium]
MKNEKRKDRNASRGKFPGFFQTLAGRPAIHIVLILIIGLAAYSNTFNVPFQFDDLDLIQSNPVIKSLDNFFLNTSGYEYNPQRCITYLTFAINYYFGQYDVTGYHIVNLAIHVTNAMLVYFLALLSFNILSGQAGQDPHSPEESRPNYSRMIALFSALLFAAHPIQTQAVTYIYQRLTSLATMFYLLSLVAYIMARNSGASSKGRRKATSATLYLLSITSAVLAMKTKEIAFTLPIIIVLYEVVFFRTTFKKKILLVLPILLTLVIIPISLIGINKPLGEILSDISAKSRLQTGMPRWDYLVTQMRVITTYVRLLFLPYRQNIDYDYPIYHSLLTPSVFFSFLFLLSIFGTGVYLLYRSRLSARPTAAGPAGNFRKGVFPLPFLPYYRLIGFGLLWFFITLSIESSIIPIVDVIFEHRVYLPSVGAFIAATSTLFLFVFKMKKKFPWAEKSIVGILTLAVLVFSCATIARNAIWKDTVTLWEDAAQKSPNKGRVHHNLGRAYDTNRKPREAFEQYLIATKVEPDLAEAHESLGISYVSIGAVNEARRELSIALQLDPDLSEARMFLDYISGQNKNFSH